MSIFFYLQLNLVHVPPSTPKGLPQGFFPAGSGAYIIVVQKTTYI